ncbi:MAG: diguanylate cyclase [Xenococcaceae cyanobacterium MO_207.B15]|nr:diguanylate cyclase [Xenococcaceae cyanobacterium MO_207.B15]
MQREYYEPPKENILIVDDSPEHLRLLSSMLVRRGYHLNCVTDGEMALYAIQASMPDLVLLDIVVPLIDGYRICQALKAHEKTRHIPVIFVSSLDSEIDKVKAFKVGCADYITKPFFIEEAFLRIEAQLKIYRQQKDLDDLLQKNIRDRNHIEQELNQSRTLLAGVLNSSLDGVAAFEAIRDSDSKIIDFRWIVVNPVAAMTVGETRESLEGKLLFEQLPGHLFDSLFDVFVQVVENCIVFDKEHQYSFDGSWFHIVAVKLGDGFAVTFRDITEKKQMEISLKQMNYKLQHQANIDSLTQVANRRRFDEYITQEWGRCTRQQKSLSVILCDVDYFKFYNDAYGHQAGDECLFQVAQGISLTIKRPADVVFRYGGEEFAVILPLTQKEGAVKVAQDIREEIKKLKIVHDLSKVSKYVTLSLGVSSIIPNPKYSVESLIAAADRALYEAKSLGRDRIVYKSLELTID